MNEDTQVRYEERRSFMLCHPGGEYDSVFSKYWPSMFAGDIGHATVLSSEKLEMIPNDSDSWYKMVSILNDQRHRDVSYAIESLFTRIAQSLAYFGEIYFELVRSNSTQKPFILLELPHIARYRWKRKTLYQDIPEEFRDQTKGVARSEILRKNVWHVTLPKTFISVKKHRQLIELLKSHDNPMAVFALQEQNLGTSFSFLEYDHRSKASVASITRNWGWAGRNAWSENCTEYALVYRLLKFATNQRILYEHIIAAFNSLLESENIQIQIRYTGNASSQYFSLMEDLKTGKAPFEKVLDYIYEH